MRAQCACGGGISTFRMSAYRDWRDTHYCPSAPEAQPQVDATGSAVLDVHGSTGDTWDYVNQVPIVNARIGFQPE